MLTQEKKKPVGEEEAKMQSGQWLSVFQAWEPSKNP